LTSPTAQPSIAYSLRPAECLPNDDEAVAQIHQPESKTWQPFAPFAPNAHQKTKPQKFPPSLTTWSTPTEARQLVAADNPLSFLHVSRPEIDLP
jgi:hypothetical protein